MKKTPDFIHAVKSKTKNMKTIREIALESLRDAIITGELKPGDQLRERELAEMMGVSTTPIKEVLRILTNEGLVETIPRKGAYVSEMVNSSIEEILLLKAAVEGLLARLAAEKMSDEDLARLEQQVEKMEQLSRTGSSEQLAEANQEFHRLIQQAADNMVIAHVSKTIEAYDRAFRKRALRFPYEIEQGFSEHRAIFEAIKARDGDEAEKRMREHIQRTIKNVLQSAKGRDQT